MFTSLRAQIHETLFKIYLRRISIALVIVIVSSLAVKTSTPARATSPLTTCVDLKTLKERISRSGTCRTSQEAVAKWRLASSDSALSSDKSLKYLKVCSNKSSSPVSYQLIRTKCARHQQESLYNRSAASPATPVITGVNSFSHDSASLSLGSDPAIIADAPVAHYTIISSKGDVVKVHTWRDLTLTINGLTSSTSYTFTVSATNADGTSTPSAVSPSVTTQVYVAPVAVATTAPLAAPDFALSAAAETRTVNTAATGFTISSTGGAIASFAINATPAGMSFNASTGALTGTPTSIQSATVYTITATNATGFAIRTFTLTVTAIVYAVGDTGPGGGKIIYVASTPFACGQTSCTYLEVAPSGWNGGSDPEMSWVSAVALANSHSVTISGQIYDDWYLPSQEELNLLYVERSVAGGLKTDYYWSSSAYPNGVEVWIQNFYGGGQMGGAKNLSLPVRAVRAF
jgi:hypothetical protein